MAHVTAIIPARLASTRFSRKVLYPLGGKPLIYYIWKAAHQAKLIDRLFVATDSVEIGRAVNAFGGSVIMTSGKPRNGTERVAQAVSDLNTDIVINIQADNLGLTGATLDRAIRQIRADRSVAFATLARPIDGRDWKAKLAGSDVVKVVEDAAGYAAWFSRYPIPFIRDSAGRKAINLFPFLEHIGVYFFRKAALMEYATWPLGRAERAESLEQLRILENGGRIKLYKTKTEILSVDSKNAIGKLERMLPKMRL
jgi:3-deoxy-manno-octulosonate cytidylyltransferase (CMP-KDO synthetase)